MPLQNRVTPFGDIVSSPSRGSFMGNRGNLHDADRRLRDRRWTRLAWITCVLEFKDRHRRVMTPGRYTELFFLDEATAFAAGHRPCAACRRRDYRRFKRLWLECNAGSLRGRPASAANIDAILHHERVAANGGKRTWTSSLADLPDGVFVSDEAGVARLLWRRCLLPWSPDGYGRAEAVDPGREIIVLTPPSLTRVVAAGLEPVVHSSAAIGV